MENNIKFLNEVLFFSSAAIFISSAIVIYLVIEYKKKQIEIENNAVLDKINLEKDRLKIELEIQEQTLSQISKEIHDNICTTLTLAKLYLNSNSNNDDFSVEFGAKCISLISKSIEDLKDLSKSIDRDVINHHGLIEAIRLEIKKVKGYKDLWFGFNTNGEIIFLNSETELMIFRIIQESMNNILKHSKARIGSIELNYYSKNLILKIRDDGVGFNIDHSNKTKKTSGIYNIERRTKMINGTCKIESKINEGTAIEINIPYK